MSKVKKKEINLFHIILIGIICSSTFSSATIKIILDFKKRFFNFFQEKNYEHNLSEHCWKTYVSSNHRNWTTKWSTSNFHAKWCPESSHSCSAHHTKQWISKWLDEQGWRAYSQASEKSWPYPWTFFSEATQKNIV